MSYYSDDDLDIFVRRRLPSPSPPQIYRRRLGGGRYIDTTGASSDDGSPPSAYLRNYRNETPRPGYNPPRHSSPSRQRVTSRSRRRRQSPSGKTTWSHSSGDSDATRKSSKDRVNAGILPSPSGVGSKGFTFDKVEEEGLSVSLQVKRNTDKVAASVDFASCGDAKPTNLEALAWKQPKTELTDSGSSCELLTIHALEHSLGSDGLGKTTLICPGGPRQDADPGSVQLRWLHVQRSVPTFDVIQRLVSNCPFLSQDLAAVTFALLNDVVEKYERISESGPYIEPGAIQRFIGKYLGDADQGERKTTEAVLFLSSPHLKMQKPAGNMVNQDEYHPRTLIQSLYGYDVEDGKRRQIVQKVAGSQSKGVLHLDQMWSILIGSDILITMSNLTAAQLRGSAVAVDLRSSTDGELVTIRLFENGRQHNSVIDLDYTYVDLLRHCVLLVQGNTSDVLEYELREANDEVLTPTRWLQLVSLSKTQLLDLYFQRKGSNSNKNALTFSRSDYRLRDGDIRPSIGAPDKSTRMVRPQGLWNYQPPDISTVPTSPPPLIMKERLRSPRAPRVKPREGGPPPVRYYRRQERQRETMVPENSTAETEAKRYIRMVNGDQFSESKSERWYPGEEPRYANMPAPSPPLDPISEYRRVGRRKSIRGETGEDSEPMGDDDVSELGEDTVDLDEHNAAKARQSEDRSHEVVGLEVEVDGAERNEENEGKDGTGLEVDGQDGIGTEVEDEKKPEGRVEINDVIFTMAPDSEQDEAVSRKASWQASGAEDMTDGTSDSSNSSGPALSQDGRKERHAAYISPEASPILPQEKSGEWTLARQQPVVPFSHKVRWQSIPHNPERAMVKWRTPPTGTENDSLLRQRRIGDAIYGDVINDSSFHKQPGPDVWHIETDTTADKESKPAKEHDDDAVSVTSSQRSRSSLATFASSVVNSEEAFSDPQTDLERWNVSSIGSKSSSSGFSDGSSSGSGSLTADEEAGEDIAKQRQSSSSARTRQTLQPDDAEKSGNKVKWTWPNKQTTVLKLQDTSAVVSVPFLAWRIRGITRQEEPASYDKNVISIMSAVNKALLKSEVKAVYSRSFKCTLQELKQRYSFLTEDASKDSDWPRRGSRGFGAGGGARDTKASSEHPGRSVQDWLLLDDNSALMKRLLEASQDILRAFIPEGGSSLGHHIPIRFWGAVDSVYRQLAWEENGQDHENERFYVVYHSDSTSAMNSKSDSNGVSPQEHCASCKSTKTYTTAREALTHIHTHNACSVNTAGPAHDDPCFVWVRRLPNDSMPTDRPSAHIYEKAEAFHQALNSLRNQTKELHGLVVNARVGSALARKLERPPLAASLVNAFTEIIKLYLLQAKALSYANRCHTRTGVPTAEEQRQRRDLREKLFLIESYKDKARHNAERLLQEAKKDIIVLGSTSRHEKSLGIESVGTQFLVLSLITNMQNREVIPEFATATSRHSADYIELYRRYLTRLRYQASKRPQRRLFLDINALQEELTAVNNIENAQNTLLERYLKLLNPDSFPVTTKTRIGHYATEKTLARKQQRVLKARIKDIGDLVERTEYLRDRVKQTIEILEEDHGKAIRVFTMVTLFFLPLSFVSSFMGMNTSDIRDMDSTQTLFWSTGMPVTAIVVVAAVVYGYYGDGIGEWLEEKMKSGRKRSAGYQHMSAFDGRRRMRKKGLIKQGTADSVGL